MREKDAVHTIMEQKIKVLVESIAQALDVVIRDPTKSSALPSGPVQALAKVSSELVIYSFKIGTIYMLSVSCRMLLHYTA